MHPHSDGDPAQQLSDDPTLRQSSFNGFPSTSTRSISTGAALQSFTSAAGALVPLPTASTPLKGELDLRQAQQLGFLPTRAQPAAGLPPQPSAFNKTASSTTPVSRDTAGDHLALANSALIPLPPARVTPVVIRPQPIRSAPSSRSPSPRGVRNGPLQMDESGSGPLPPADGGAPWGRPRAFSSSPPLTAGPNAHQLSR